MTSPGRDSAIEVLEQIQENVSCTICMMPFSDPKMLFCRHEFCKKCLKPLVTKFEETLIVTCPLCRLDTCLPHPEGVAGLQPAHHLQKLLELESSLQRKAGKIITCAHHENENMSLYCDQCQSLICGQCTIQDHNGHHYRSLKDVCGQHKQELATEIEVATKIHTSTDQLMISFRERAEGISMQQEALESQINSAIDQLQQALEAKRLALLDNLRTLSTSKLQSLNARKGELEILNLKLQSSIEEGRSLLEDPCELIMNKDRCIKTMKQNSVMCQTQDHSQIEEANMTWTGCLKNPLQSIDAFGAITTCKACPQNCIAKGNALSSAFVGETAKVTVYVMDNMSHACKEGSFSDINFTLNFGQQTLGFGVAKRIKDNHYELTYVPTFKGYHQLNITIRDHHICSSPFRVAVKASVTSLGLSSKSIVHMKSPCGIAINKDHVMLITSEEQKCITMVEQCGELIQEIGGGCFSDITAGSDGAIYVTSIINNVVAKFSPKGTLLKTTADKELAEPLKFASPMGITFHTSNKKLYVSNTNSHEIIVLDEDLNYCKTIGREGTGKLQFKYPRGICCDCNGRLIVADSKNDRIQIFTAEGKFLRMLGHPGNQEGQLKWPLGVATDSSRNVYVTEGANNRVSVFSTHGHFIKSFSGSATTGMKKPTGIAVDSVCGTVFVCNYGHDLIQTC